MKKLKHSKYKNTGILFELLVRQIATDTLNNKDSYATRIIKEHFSKSTELSKELKLYKLFIDESFDSDYKASEFVNIILTERKKLNESALNRQKYNLIKSISPHILVKGGDYKGRKIIGQEIADELKLVDFVHGKSSTQTILKIQKGC